MLSSLFFFVLILECYHPVSERLLQCLTWLQINVDTVSCFTCPSTTPSQYTPLLSKPGLQAISTPHQVVQLSDCQPSQHSNIDQGLSRIDQRLSTCTRGRRDQGLVLNLHGILARQKGSGTVCMNLHAGTPGRRDQGLSTCTRHSRQRRSEPAQHSRQISRSGRALQQLSS